MNGQAFHTNQFNDQLQDVCAGIHLCESTHQDLGMNAGNADGACVAKRLCAKAGQHWAKYTVWHHTGAHVHARDHSKVMKRRASMTKSIRKNRYEYCTANAWYTLTDMVKDGTSHCNPAGGEVGLGVCGCV
jgi:hypothetical protein